MSHAPGPKMPGDQELAGLWCHQVLAALSEYLDDTLSPELRAQAEDHLRQCDTCATFGGKMAHVVKALKAQLSEPAPISETLKDALITKMKR